MEESTEADKEIENGDKSKTINEENIAKAAAASLAAAAVKAKVDTSWMRGFMHFPFLCPHVSPPLISLFPTRYPPISLS